MASELARTPFLLEALHPSDSCSSLPSSRMVLSLSIVEAETSSPISWFDLRGLPPLRVRTLCTITCGRAWIPSLICGVSSSVGSKRPWLGLPPCSSPSTYPSSIPCVSGDTDRIASDIVIVVTLALTITIPYPITINGTSCLWLPCLSPR